MQRETIASAVALIALMATVGCGGGGIGKPGYVDDRNADMRMYYPDPPLKNDPAVLKTFAEGGEQMGCKAVRPNESGLVLQCTGGEIVLVQNGLDPNTIAVGCRDAMRADCVATVKKLRGPH